MVAGTPTYPFFGSNLKLLGDVTAKTFNGNTIATEPEPYHGELILWISVPEGTLGSAAFTASSAYEDR